MSRQKPNPKLTAVDVARILCRIRENILIESLDLRAKTCRTSQEYVDAQWKFLIDIGGAIFRKDIIAALEVAYALYKGQKFKPRFIPLVRG